MPSDVLVTQTLPTLINGISQQPATQRLESQVQLQENMLSQVDDGPASRPPSEHIALLGGSAAGGSPTGGVYCHTIDRGDGERFLVIIEDSDINVFDLSDGTESLVLDAAAGSAGSYTYLDINTGAGQTAQDAFEAVTIADYTFIINKFKNTAMSGSTDAARTHAHEFILSCTFPDHNFDLTIGATTAVGGATPPVAVEGAMDALCNAAAGTLKPNDTIGTAGGSFADWKFTRISDGVLHAYQFQNANDTYSVSFQAGETGYELIGTGSNGEDPAVDRFSDLPHQATDGFVVKVKGDDGTDGDEFYVKYVAEEKVWKEVVKPGLDNDFDADTMPHTLAYDSGTGNFTFGTPTWVSREVGDTISAPEPSFIGARIKDILIHDDRLTLLSGENVIASEKGEYFNFWPTTATALIDADMFDTAGTGSRVSNWDFGVPFRGNISLFSSIGDVVSELVRGDGQRLTTETALVEERGAHSHSKIRPVTAGDNLYFFLERGENTSVFQYTEDDIELYRADEITNHVEQYLPKNIVKVAPGRAENILTFFSSETDEDHRLYVYRYHYVNREQLMASWSRWSFDDNATIINVDWIESICYLLIERQDGFHLEKIDLGKTDEDEGSGTALGFRVGLDSLVKLTGSYAAGPDETTWTLPYDQNTNGGTWRIVKSGEWVSTAGTEITVKSSAVDLSITAAGDFSANAVYIGREYTWILELSEILLRDKTSSRSNPGARVGGRLQVGRGKIQYVDAGTFDVRIRSKQDATIYADLFEITNLDSLLLITSGSLESGFFSFLIGGNSRDVEVVFRSSSYLPTTLVSFDWEGRYFQRSEQA